MFSKTQIALSAAMVLSIGFPASDQASSRLQYGPRSAIR